MTVKDLFNNLRGLYNPQSIVPRDHVVISSAIDVSAWTDKTGGADGQRRAEILPKYRKIYRSGGILKSGLDLYPHFALCGGYTLNSDDDAKNAIDDVRRILESRNANFDEVIYQVLADAINIGDGYAKILNGSNAYSDTPVGLQHLPAERVIINVDQTMQITSYTLQNEQGSAVATIMPDEILHLVVFPDGANRYGVGLIESAYDDIRNDCTVAESTSAAIKRHGFGIWHASVSSGDPSEPVRPADVDAVKKALTKISARSEIVTSSNIEIKGLNETGQSGVIAYADWSVMRLCTALGVPGELLGLRQGTTDATAVERIRNFYRRIQTIQGKLAACVNQQFIDRILSSFGLPLGSVWIEYRDPTPDDDNARVRYVSGIAAINPDDPHDIMSRRQMQTYLGIDSDEWERDEVIL